MRTTQAGSGRRSTRRLTAILVAAFVLWPIVVTGAVGGARADLFGLPQFVGFVTNDGYFFVEVGTTSFGSFTPIGPGSQIFGTGLTLVVFGLTSVNRTVVVHYAQYPGGGPQYVNLTFVAIAKSVTVTEIAFPITTHFTDAILNVDGSVLNYQVETPILLIPLTNLTNGGFDLILLGILSELLIFGLPLIILARYLTRKALWAPKVKAVLWLHGIILGIASFVVLDFPLVNQIAGGWGWFAYPIPIAIFIFFWAASLFNRADVVEVLRANTAAGHRLTFDRWQIRVGRNTFGDLVLLGRRWRDWVFGFLGHHVILAARDAEERGFEPQRHQVLLHDGMGETRRSRPAGGKIRWPTPSKERPEDDFKIRNAQERAEDDPAYIYFVASSEPVEVEWPHVSMHQWKEVPDRYDRDGNLIVPGHRKRALAWPHIVDGKAMITLATIHYADVVAVAMGWKTVEDVVKVAEQRHLQVYLLKAHMRTEIARQVEQALIPYLDLTTRTGEELTDEEAEAEVERRPRSRGTPKTSGPDMTEADGE